MSEIKLPPAAARPPDSIRAAAGDDEAKRVADVLSAEYGVLMAALTSSWSTSLARTSIFLGVLSAAGIALGFAAQGGGGTGAIANAALVVLPLLLFLGVATFARLIQIQRESIIYTTGMNRIRHFMQIQVPKSRPYFVLSGHDDLAAVYRSPGAGMYRRPPRFPLLYLAVQTQGVVGVVTAGVAAAFAGLLLSAAGSTVSWAAVVIGFLVTVGVLFTYWKRSVSELFASIEPLNPTPPEDLGAPF